MNTISYQAQAVKSHISIYCAPIIAKGNNLPENFFEKLSPAVQHLALPGCIQGEADREPRKNKPL